MIEIEIEIAMDDSGMSAIARGSDPRRRERFEAGLLL
jgi:hypothetical protein